MDICVPYAIIHPILKSGFISCPNFNSFMHLLQIDDERLNTLLLAYFHLLSNVNSLSSNIVHAPINASTGICLIFISLNVIQYLTLSLYLLNIVSQYLTNNL